MPRRAMTKCHTPALLCFDPPTGLVPEFEFTQYEYLVGTEDGEILATLSLQTISEIILRPNTSDHDIFTTTLMRRSGTNDPPRPAHIPNMLDTYPVRCEFQTFMQWCLGTLPPSSYNPEHLRPAFHLLDPKQELNFDAPVWELDYASIRLCVGSYTDTFQICKVPPFPHILHVRIASGTLGKSGMGYHKVDLTPFEGAIAKEVISGPYGNIPPDSIVCCWNVRGMGRPTLIENFNTLYKIHKPAIVIMLEIRQGYETVKMIVRELVGEYSFRHSETEIGVCGGVVYLWRPEVVVPVTKRVYSTSVKADVYFKGHPRSRHCLFD